MADIHNLNKHKNSKIILEDLEVMLKIVNIATAALAFYPMYKVSQRITAVLKEEKVNILAEIERCKNKGKV